MLATASYPNRRGFLGGSAAVAAAIVGAQLHQAGSAHAQARTGERADIANIRPGSNTSFAALKQIDAGVLNVGYAEVGPANGPVVMLLHGWPYDIYSFRRRRAALGSAGYRVIVPFLRGYGTTRFLSNQTSRNGQPSAIAADMIALMDALKIEKATIARLRLGRADSQHHGCALAGPLQGHGVGERLSDRQPGSRQEAIAAQG